MVVVAIQSHGLLTDFKSGIYTLLLSVLTDAEVQDAPDEVKDVYAEFRKYAKEIIELTPEAIKLADVYLDHNILTLNFSDDARHIAMATVAGADVLVSWNFKHIVHFEKIRGYHGVNLIRGYPEIPIHSPTEVVPQ